MKKDSIINQQNFENFVYKRFPKMIVPVSHVVLDDTIETSQGEERTVRMLYEDYVLGRLDVRDLGGLVQYDPDDATECDPLNQFGVTLEESTRIADAGVNAKKDIAQHIMKRKAEEAAAKAAQQASAAVQVPDPPKE